MAGGVRLRSCKGCGLSNGNAGKYCIHCLENGKTRNCMNPKCKKEFMSVWAGNRYCPECNNTGKESKPYHKVTRQMNNRVGQTRNGE